MLKVEEKKNNKNRKQKLIPKKNTKAGIYLQLASAADVSVEVKNTITHIS